MRRITAFESISLDGFFTDANSDMSWAHKHDDEWNAFTSGNARGGGALMFGRKTYDMMAAFWPTPAAAERLPEVASQMNALPKFVFSRTLKDASWSNTTVLNEDPKVAAARMKKEPGPDITILGSGSLVSQLSEAGLIDAYQFALVNIVLGKGRTLFETVKDRINLELKESRAFKNGNVFLHYAVRR